MRRSERLLTGGSDPVREFSPSMSVNRAKRCFNVARAPSGLCEIIGGSPPLFSGEARNTRNGVESDRAPISQLAGMGSYIIYKSRREI